MKKKLFAVIAVALMVAVVSGWFLKDTIKYASLSYAIENAETVGKQGIYINGNRVVWTPEQVDKYNEAVARKNSFIEKSDVAQFLHDCGNSVTGQIMRMLDIMLAIALLLFSLALALEASKRLIKILSNSVKKRARHIINNTFKRAKV